jgi:L-malate glycosyltransferase
MEPIHIIHVSTATSWRGGEQQLAYLIQGLKPHGVDQQVLCVEKAPFAEYCLKNGIATTTFQKRGTVNLKAAAMLARKCKTNQEAIVHCHDSHAHSIAYMAALIFRNPARIVIHRRVDFPVSKNYFSNKKYNHPKIAKFICVSEAIKKILVPALKEPAKASVIHSGIDLMRFEHVENKGLLKKEFGLSANNILIGNVSALAPHKDYFTFIGTAEILLKNNPHFRFVIIGEGPERAAIEAEIQKKNLQDSVLMAGFRKNIPELLKELNVLLLTSKTEGLGTTILDAFACGIPVVATKAGGIPEIVEHKVSGLLADVGNTGQLAEMIVMIIKDENLKKNLIRIAKDKIEKFNFKITSANTLDIYRAIKYL